jgi:hypothetical protein
MGLPKLFWPDSVCALRSCLLRSAPLVFYISKSTLHAAEPSMFICDLKGLCCVLASGCVGTAPVTLEQRPLWPESGFICWAPWNLVAGAVECGLWRPHPLGTVSISRGPTVEPLSLALTASLKPFLPLFILLMALALIHPALLSAHSWSLPGGPVCPKRRTAPHYLFSLPF